MRGLEEYRLKIDGFTPITIPMCKLAEYLSDLSELLGSEEHLHLLSVIDGSAEPAVWVQRSVTTKVERRLLSLKSGTATASVNKAFEKLDARLRCDNTFGKLYGKTSGTIIEFPGSRRPGEKVVGPIMEPGTVDGEIVRIGGLDETISVHLRDGDTIHNCQASRDQGRELGKLVFSRVRLSGRCEWSRSESGVWERGKFYVEGYSVLSPDNLRESIQRLRNLASPDMPDALAYLERLNAE